MRFGISIPNFAAPGQLVDVARRAERHGWDGFFLWDHILVERHGTVPISEPWTVLAHSSPRWPAGGRGCWPVR